MYRSRLWRPSNRTSTVQVPGKYRASYGSSVTGASIYLLVMSYQLFHTEMMALTGKQHILRHFDSMTAGGIVINANPKLPILQNGFQVICNMDIRQHTNVNWIEQIGQYILIYWAGMMVLGPTGTVAVTDVGKWNAIKVKQNMNFNIILWSFEMTARIHLLTMLGIYTSSVVPGVSAPWTGAMLQAMG